MLILTRNITEEILFFQNKKILNAIRILGVDGCQVRIGIEALDDINIYRSEVFTRKYEEEAQKFLMEFYNEINKKNS